MNMFTQNIILCLNFRMFNWRMTRHVNSNLYSIKNDSSFRRRLLRGVRLYRILVLVGHNWFRKSGFIRGMFLSGVQIIQTNIPSQTRWRFPKISKMGVLLNHPFIDGFSLINHPAIGCPDLWKPPHVRNISPRIFAKWTLVRWNACSV